MINQIQMKLRLYWSLIKSLQTLLLLITGLAGYMSARCPIFNIGTLLALSGSLFLAISGSTVLNMWYDRDIDARMHRTCWRPLPTGKVTSGEAFRLGLLLSGVGVGWAFMLNWFYGTIVFAGLFFDVVVYTLWLKRRTAWAVLWGGIAGGMPVLAGRVLGAGGLEWIGLLMALGVVLWIPTHYLTFNMRFFDDYNKADLPTFPETYGFRATRGVIAFSSIAAAVAMIGAAVGIGVAVGFLWLMAGLSFGLLVLAAVSLVRPSEKVNFGLFKYASLYMLSSMLLMAMDFF